jgi:hypothetical protein
MTSNQRGVELHRKHVVLNQPLTIDERAELDAWYAQMDAIERKILSSDPSPEAIEIVPENQGFSLESDRIQRGRLIVIVVIAAVLLISCFTFLAGIARSNLSPFAMVRFALTIGLCVMLWRGHSWARWLSAVLFGLGGIAAILVLASSATDDNPMIGTTMLFFGVIYFAISATLILSSDVRAFAVFQRNEYSLH